MVHDYLNYSGLSLYNRLLHDELELLRRLYEGLTQSKIVVVETLPSTGEYNTIYRIPGEESFSDYMWNGSRFVRMAQYDNAIDETPTENSNNLVKSGGVYDFVMKKTTDVVFDVSAYNEGMAYASLSAALLSVPEEEHRGGLWIKFIDLHSNLYQQWLLLKNTWTTDTQYWQGVDYLPTDNSINLISSGSVKQALDAINEDIDNLEQELSDLESELQEVDELVANLYDMDNIPTKDSEKLVKSGGVYTFVLHNSGVFDVSAYYNNRRYDGLAEALEDIPGGAKKGGMTVRFINSVTLRYEQWRNTKNSFSTLVEDWQGIDTIPTLNSQNLITSDGVKRGLNALSEDIAGLNDELDDFEEATNGTLEQLGGDLSAVNERVDSFSGQVASIAEELDGFEETTNEALEGFGEGLQGVTARVDAIEDSDDVPTKDSEKFVKSGGVYDALSECDQKIELIIAGVKVSLSASPSVIYKAQGGQTVTITGTMTNGTPSSMKIFDGDTVLASGSTSPIKVTLEPNVTYNSKSFTLQGVTLGMTFNASASFSARYPLYYGFGNTASEVAIEANKHAATTSAARTYTKTASVDGQNFFILVPTDIGDVSTFVMNGAPFVMNAVTTETIGGVSYKVHKSGNIYNSGVTLKVSAS